MAVATQLAPTERADSRFRFRHDLAAYRSLQAWWSPGRRRVIFRQMARLDCRKSRALPDDARQIGSYAFPFPADLFMDDLDAVVGEK